jgi:broad specificity phosphatase PhoE
VTAARPAPPRPPAGATTVYVVRHGETDWNARGLCQGSADVPLNARGRAEVARLAASLARVRFDAAYSSPLGRARDTAALLLEGSGLRAARWDAFAELGYGAWQGTAEVEWPGGAGERWRRDPWSIAFPGGESLDGVYRRAAPAWDRLVAAHAGERVLLSAHGHLNRVLLIHALGWPRDRFWRIGQPNAGCVVVHVPACGRALLAAHDAAAPAFAAPRG